jgi:uncharacterized membrane protein YbhN (UPF0104 family)
VGRRFVRRLLLSAIGWACAVALFVLCLQSIKATVVFALTILLVTAVLALDAQPHQDDQRGTR